LQVTKGLTSEEVSYIVCAALRNLDIPLPHFTSEECGDGLVRHRADTQFTRQYYSDVPRLALTPVNAHFLQEPSPLLDPDATCRNDAAHHF
jgi:hypothetical protein